MGIKEEAERLVDKEHVHEVLCVGRYRTEWEEGSF